MAQKRLFPSFFIALSLLGCGGDKPPPKVAHEGAGTQIRRVSVRWGDTFEEATVVANNSNGLVESRFVTKRELTLGEGEAVTLRVDRDEAYQTKSGNFTCKAGAEVKGKVTYRWESGEAVMQVSFPASQLKRKCTTSLFPFVIKDPEATELTLVLRDDRLIGKGAEHNRTVLLPLQ